MPKLKKETKELRDKQFAKEYIKEGQNATKAYLNLRSGKVSNQVARNEGSKLTKDPDVRREITRLLDEQGVTRRYLNERLKKTAQKSLKPLSPTTQRATSLLNWALNYTAILRKRITDHPYR